MTLAADTLAGFRRAAAAVGARLGTPVAARGPDRGSSASVAAEATVALAAQTADGTLAVIGPQGRLAELGAAVTAVLPEAGVGEPGAGQGAGADGPDLERPVVVLTVRQAKGLEFDSVLVADPAMILAESPRGLGDLYVALTRATQRNGVVHTGELPSVLTGWPPSAASPR